MLLRLYAMITYHSPAFFSVHGVLLLLGYMLLDLPAFWSLDSRHAMILSLLHEISSDYFYFVLPVGLLFLSFSSFSPPGTVLSLELVFPLVITRFNTVLTML